MSQRHISHIGHLLCLRALRAADGMQTRLPHHEADHDTQRGAGDKRFQQSLGFDGYNLPLPTHECVRRYRRPTCLVDVSIQDIEWRWMHCGPSWFHIHTSATSMRLNNRRLDLCLTRRQVRTEGQKHRHDVLENLHVYKQGSAYFYFGPFVEGIAI